MQTFEQLLDPRELSGSFEATPSLMEYELTNTFYTAPRDVRSDQVEMIYYPAITQPAPLNARGAEARVLTPSGGTQRFHNLFHAFNQTPLPADALRALRNPDNFDLQEKGRLTVERINEELQTRMRLTKEAIIASIITTGRVNLDSGGNVLTPSVNADSGAVTDANNTVISADFGVANSHRGRLNDSSDGYLISQAELWSNSATKISRHLEALKYRASKRNVAKPTDIYVHSLAKNALRDNEEFRLWAVESNRAVEAVLRGEMIEDLWGFNWHFVGGTYQDASGTTRDLIPQTVAVIMPPPSQPWIRAYRGLELVPSQVGVVSSVDEALNNLMEVFGEFQYASLEHNPARIDLFSGDNWSVNFADPDAIWMPTVFDSTSPETSGTGA